MGDNVAPAGVDGGGGGGGDAGEGLYSGGGIGRTGVGDIWVRGRVGGRVRFRNTLEEFLLSGLYPYLRRNVVLRAVVPPVRYVFSLGDMGGSSGDARIVSIRAH